jgi:WD40 repeat protein
MAVEVAIFTPRAPVSLFESEKVSLDTVFESVIRPNLFAEVDARGAVRALRNTTAVLTAMTLSNSSASARTVDIRIRSSRRVTYNAEVTAQAGENWVRLDRTTRPRGVAIFGYDWSQTPPVRLSQEPTQLVGIMRDLAWTSDSAYVAATQDGPNFAIYDANDGFAAAYTAPDAPSPVRTDLCAWSPNGRYLAVTYFLTAGTGHPFIKVFDFDFGIDTPVEVVLPSVDLVTRQISGLAWGGPGGRYLVASDVGSARVIVWDWDTGSPVLASGLGTTLSNALAGTAGAVAFNTDVSAPRLAVGHTAGDRLSVFNFPSATTVAKISDALFAANTTRNIPAKGLAWSKNSRYLAVLSGADASIPFTVFDFNGGVSLRPAPPSLPPLPFLRCLDWSGDGRYLVVGHAESARYTYYPEALPYLLLFDYGTGTPVRVRTSPTLQGFGNVTTVEFSPDGDTLMVAGWAYDRFYPPTGVDNVRLEDAGGVNYIVNGSFEDTTGMTRTSFGFTATGEIASWFTDQEPKEAVTLFFPNKRFVDAFATDGAVYLDVVAAGSAAFGTQNDARLRQNISGLVEGQDYTLSVDVTASLESDIGLRLLWNGVEVDISGETTLPIVEDFSLLSLEVPAGASVRVPLDKHMLAYGDVLQMRASGSGVDTVVSYILSTQEQLNTVTAPPEPSPEGDLGE